MNQRKSRNDRPRDFVRRPFSPLRVLWFSRMWIALALLALGYGLTFHVNGTPLYATVILLGGGALYGAWRWRDTASMWRAARWGEVRQATVSGFSDTHWHTQGFTLKRMHWSDAVGAKGSIGPARRDRFPAAGTRIIVYADPKTGRTWWEDRL